MVLTIVQIIGSFLVGFVISYMVDSIACMPDTSMKWISKAIKRDEGIIYAIKYILSTLVTLLFAILICIIIGISYTAAMIFLPLSVTSFALAIILAKAEKMPITMLTKILRNLLLESLITEDQGRNLKKLFFWFFIDLFFARASKEQAKGLILYFGKTISLAKSKTERIPLKFKNLLKEHSYDLIIILFVLVFTGIYVICLSIAIVHMIDGTYITPELTTGFISLIFGISLMLNNVRIQELEKDA